jgi:hypothetical protein
MATVDVVVARYEENLDWLGELPSCDTCNVYVYDKSGSVDWSAGGAGRRTNIRLLNVGREAHTYAVHVCENYDQLADCTVFLQGRPFDHCEKQAVIDAITMRPEQYMPLGKCFVCDADGKRHHGGLDLHGAFPSSTNRTHFVFCVGAQFAVPRAILRRRSLEEWRRVRSSLETGSINAWQMERMWGWFLGV